MPNNESLKIGDRYSKKILERINLRIKNATKLNSSKSTAEVIKWSKSADRNNSSFTCFDMSNFYPTITEELSKKAQWYLRPDTPK